MTNNPNAIRWSSFTRILLTGAKVGILVGIYAILTVVIVVFFGIGLQVLPASTVWLGALMVSALFGGTIVSDVMHRKRMAKEAETILEKLKAQGFSMTELESIASFVNRDPEIGLMLLQDREELGKDEFLALIGDLNTYTCRETWQYKLAVVAVFSLVLALVLVAVTGGVLLWR
jgi:hypothetical protein